MVAKRGISMARPPFGENNFRNILKLKAFVTIARRLGKNFSGHPACLNVAHFHWITKMCCAAEFYSDFPRLDLPPYCHRSKFGVPVRMLNARVRATNNRAGPALL
jgi:hypothetical protein